jgi:hypothetical protein
MMVLYDMKNKLFYKAINSNEPKMTNSHQGRSWGYVWKTVNGEPTKFWIDFTRGRYLYFQYGRKWYRVQYLQPNVRKTNEDIFNGVLVDLIVDGKELKLLKGNVEKYWKQAI